MTRGWTERVQVQLEDHGIRVRLYMYGVVFEVSIKVIMYWRQVGRIGKRDQYCCKLLYVAIILEPLHNAQIYSKYKLQI